MKKLSCSFVSVIFISFFSLPAMAQIWGTHPFAGSSRSGVIYRTDGNGLDLQVLKTFNADPMGAQPLGGRLVKASNGKMYGTTEKGGDHNDGVIFEYDPSTNTYTKKFDFDYTVSGAESHGSLMLASNGKLYGTTYRGGSSGSGVLFQFDPGTGTYTKVRDFTDSYTGHSPGRQLVESNGKLYGFSNSMASAAGVIFELNLTGNVFTQKIEFPNGGTVGVPTSLMVAANGKIYGTAAVGGANNMGVVFEYDPANNTYQKQAEFNGTNGTVTDAGMAEAPNGKFYVVTNDVGSALKSVIAEFDPVAKTITKKHDFTGSYYTLMGDLLLASDGKFYGMHKDAASSTGFLFQYDYVSDQYTVKYTFTMENGLSAKGGSLTESGGLLYGLLNEGGAHNAGVVFVFDLASNAFTKKIDFIYAPSGVEPRTGLTLAPNGKLYGTTYRGGEFNMGIVYELDPVTSISVKKFDFSPTFGGWPKAKLTLHPNGKMYGTMSHGGTELGTIYEFDPATGNVNKKFDPDYLTYGSVRAELMLAPSGKLYEFVSSYTGSSVLEYDPVKDTLISKASISGSYTAFGTLAVAPNSKFYMVTFDGGSAGNGAILEFDPVTSALSKKYDFTGSNGKNSSSTLTLGTNGKFYGTTFFTNNTQFSGNIFEYDPSTGQFLVKQEFNGAQFGGTGVWSECSLVVGTNGHLFGTTTSGAGLGYGAIFEYDYINNNIAHKSDLPFVREPISNSYSERTPTVLVASPTSQQIFLSATDSRPYSLETFDLSGMATSALPITYTSSNSDVATVSGKTITMQGLGTTTITAHQTGNANFTEAAQMTQELTITIGSQTISLEAVDSKPLSIGSFELAATTTSGLSISYSSSNTAVATVSGSTVTLVAPGTTTITATQPGNALFGPAPAAHQELTVTKNPQTITFEALPAKTFGDAAFEVTATSSSGLPVTFAAGSTGVISMTGNVVTVVGGGSTTIIASQSGNDLIEAAQSVSQTLTVNKADQTITFATPASKTFGETITLTATASSGLTVTFISLNDVLSLVNGNLVSKKPGIASVKAEQAGNANYKAATAVAQDFCINPAKPVISGTGSDTESIILTSNSATGNQWYKDGASIANADKQTFVATSAGTYSLKVTEETCVSEFSANFTVIITGDLDRSDHQVKLFPNPAEDKLFVRAPCQSGCDLTIVTTEGKKMEKFRFSSTQTEIDVRNYSPGTYLIKVIGTTVIWDGKFMKR